MRLKQHLTESMDMNGWDNLSTALEKDCMPYIKFLKGCRSLLARGSKKELSGDMVKVNQRQDRTPLFIHISLHKLMDVWTKKHWKFKARSASTFTTNREHNARAYGAPYLMWPIGKFKYAWNDNVTELYRSYDDWYALWYKEMDDPDESIKAKKIAFGKYIEPHLKEYKLTNLDAMLRESGERYGHSEAIINCKSYYLVKPIWRATLIGWFGDRYWRNK